MTLWRSLLDQAEGRTLHATLIDPDTSSTSEAARIAEAATDAGTDLFLLGGSTDVTGQLVQETADAVKKVATTPVLLFPSNHQQVARGLDGLLFTIPFNSTRHEYIIEEQARGAGPILAADLEAITTAYVIVEPGMTVGRVAEADLVARDEAGAQRARRYAELAAILGMDAVYLEAGSGAPDPVPESHIAAAAQTGVPVIAGGGIRSPETALVAAEAGARMVVTGTLAEDGELDRLRALIAALR